MLTQLSTPQEAALWCNTQRASGNKIGFVPTMGALHEGHSSLIKRAVEENDVTCVSIFVNPLQFNNPSDLENYPIDTESDHQLLETLNVDMVFTGAINHFFSDSQDAERIKQEVDSPFIKGLEGHYRPGHLQGVWAIVERLFLTVGNCTAYFGQKDYQQSLLVTDLANKMGGIHVVVCPIVREASGLALSSRNQLLSKSERETASKIYQALLSAKTAWNTGIHEAETLESILLTELTDEEFEIEYAAIRSPDQWSENTPDGELINAQALVAIQLGSVRLIDNMRLDEK